MNNFNFDLDNTIDEDFFSSLKESKSSKLQQLFVDDALSSDDKQQSLKYQRPKDLATSSDANITLMAKVVTAYRQGNLQGKVGLALIENSNNTCNIIMYKTKNHILATLKLQPGENLLYKQIKYWQFYDEVATYWSFSFDTETDEKEFVDKLSIKNITFKRSQETEQVAEKHLEILEFNNEKQEIISKDATGVISAGAAKETRNALINRMAKMGKPIPTLPSSNQQTTTDFSDSSDTEIIKTPLTTTLKPFIAPRSNKLNANKSNQQLVSSVVGFNSPCAVYNPLESQYMQIMLTEQRTQSSELRMNMNKLENKIEKVLDKLKLYDRNDCKQRPEKEDIILELEEKVLMLKKENRKLKQNLEETCLKKSEENKIKDLLYEFREDLEEFNIDYKRGLRNVLIELNDKLKERNNKMQEIQQKLDHNELNLKEVKRDLELKILSNIDLQNEISSLRDQENKCRLTIKEKETEILKQNEELLVLQNNLQETLKKTPDGALVKSIMNKLYVDIADKINNANLPHSEQILSLIASSIKQQTLQSLQQMKPKDI